MNILVALDTSPHSIFVIREVARLAANTWADVTLLGIEHEEESAAYRFGSGHDTPDHHPIVTALRNCREQFLSFFEGDDSPYAETALEDQLLPIRDGVWEDLRVSRGVRKHLVTRISLGKPVDAILDEARHSACDLIVMGGGNAAGSGEVDRLAHKVVKKADTSVLVVAEQKQPDRIVCCLDHSQVSQQSLELINQMVTLYGADLEIVGLSTAAVMETDVDAKISEILKYYAANGIRALVRMVNVASLETFASQAARDNLVALWMGKQSILERFMPIQRVDRVLSAAGSSVLILR